VLPVLKALQGHPEAGGMGEKHINKILDDFDIVYTAHERSIYRGTIDGKVVLLCRQVDDIAVENAKYLQSILSFSMHWNKSTAVREMETVSLGIG
jgi:hypothetical protein